MNVEILCSSRELFGADRSALRLAEALGCAGLKPTLVLPSGRPELGLSEEARQRGIPSREEPIAIVSSRGIEVSRSAHHRRARADLTIFNSTAVLGSAHRVARKIVVVREWLDPHSPRHRLLAARHRIGADAVVGVSAGAIGQWRKCIRGPARQYVVHNWLDREMLDKAATANHRNDRAGILCIGRFNRWKGQDALADAYQNAFSTDTDRPAMKFVGSQPGTDFDRPAEVLVERGRHLGWKVLPFTSQPSTHFWSAALVVVPSLQPEPFGTVILEALAHGCRVIAFDGGGPTDIAPDFPSGLKLVSRQGSALANSLDEWWKQGGHPLSAAESAEARRQLESRYSPGAGAASWQAIVDALSIRN